MLPSYWADTNPLALRAGLDRSICASYQAMQSYRRRYRLCDPGDFTRAHLSMLLEGAARERNTLLVLLDIRKGVA